MHITLQYFDGCPNWRLAEARLRRLLDEVGRPGTTIALERVETHEDAVRLGFRGSPTVLIDGRDPFADERAAIGLACRVYEAGEGLEGAPSIDQLREVISPMG